MTSRSKGSREGVRDFVTTAIVIKGVTMGGEGFKKCPKMRDVIYGRALMVKEYSQQIFTRTSFSSSPIFAGVSMASSLALVFFQT